MKRILLSILVSGIFLLSACGAPTTAPEAEAPPTEQTAPAEEAPTTEQTAPAEETEPPPTTVPTHTPAPMPGAMPAPTPTSEPRPFPRPTDIFLFQQDWGPWFDAWVKGTIPELVSQTHATAIGVAGGAAYFDEDEESYRDNMDIAHSWGIKHIVWLSTADAQDIDLQDRPELLEATCIDIDGEIIPFHVTGLPLQCTNNPVWRQFLLETAKRSVDWGADGIAMDEWLGTFDTVDKPNGGCFCEYCMQGFKEYLEGKYSAEQLRSFGIENIDNFDYGEFVRQRYLTTYREDRWKVPLIFDFQDYQMKSIKDFWHEFTSEVRGYAMAQGKDIYFSANTPELYSVWLPVQDQLDYLSPEWTFAYPPKGRSIPAYKIATSLGKPAFITPHCRMGELMSRSDMTTLMKIYTAEAYSAGGFFIVPYRINMWLPQPGAYPVASNYYADMEELSPYYDFIHNNGLYYENLASTSRIAVLYSYPSARWNWRDFNGNFYGTCNLLLDAHFQFDVLFAGDDDWIEDELSLEALNRYEVVILPNTRNLSDQQFNLLLSYADSGGHLVGFGGIGSRDEKGHEVQREQLKSLLVKGSHSYGRGQFIYIEDKIGSDYFISRRTSTREEFAEQLRGLIYPNIQTDASENVAMLEYWNGETGSIVIHLINYAYDIDTQSLSPQENINLEIVLYEELLGKDLAVYYSSPDWIGVEELDYELSGGIVRFQVPELDFYVVVSIGQA